MKDAIEINKMLDEMVSKYQKARGLYAREELYLGWVTALEWVLDEKEQEKYIGEEGGDEV